MAVIAVFLMTATAFTFNAFSGSEPALADVPNYSIQHVYLDIGDQSVHSLRSQYAAFIRSLRAAAGHQFRNGVEQTQTDATNRLIRVDVNIDRRNQGNTGRIQRRLSLWLTPNNLYVVGFQNEAGNYWSFSDNVQPLEDAIANIHILGGTGSGNGGNLANPFQFYRGHLPFGGNYNALRQAAGRGRESMPISSAALQNAVINLATTTNPAADSQNVARSLMFMIQFTSEAARFVDVERTMADIVGFRPNTGLSYSGLSNYEQDLENNWDRISQFAYRVTQNPNTVPLVLAVVGTLRTYFDVQRLMGQIIGSTKQVPFNGNPDHSEL